MQLGSAIKDLVSYFDAEDYRSQVVFFDETNFAREGMTWQIALKWLVVASLSGKPAKFFLGAAGENAILCHALEFDKFLDWPIPHGELLTRFDKFTEDMMNNGTLRKVIGEFHQNLWARGLDIEPSDGGIISVVDMRIHGVKPRVLNSPNDLWEFTSGLIDRGGYFEPQGNYVFRGATQRRNAYLMPSLLRYVQNERDVPPGGFYFKKDLAIDINASLLRNFVNRIYSVDPGLIDKHHDAPLAIFCAARHYGVPSFLLDFSASAIVGQYFASIPGLDLGRAGFLWRIDVSKLLLSYPDWTKAIVQDWIDLPLMEADKLWGEASKRFQRGESTALFPIIFRAHYLDGRMRAQASRFLVMSEPSMSLGEWVEAEASRLVSDGVIDLAIIPAGLKRGIRYLLHSSELDSANFFPDYMGAAGSSIELMEGLSRDLIGRLSS